METQRIRSTRQTRRRLLWAAHVLAISTFSWGCGGTDQAGVRRAIAVQTDDFHPDSLEVILVLPSGSRIDPKKDPDDIAPGLATAKLQAVFAAAGGSASMRLVSQNEIVDKNLHGVLAQFYRDWLGNPEDGDKDRIRQLALRLRAETLLFSGVHKWDQNNKRTQVGMIAGLFDGASGKLLWWSEQVHEVPTPAGDPNAPLPDFVVVMDRVVEALAEAFPQGQSEPLE